MAFDTEPFEVEEKDKVTPSGEATESTTTEPPKAIVPPKTDEFLWAWKVRFSSSMYMLQLTEYLFREQPELETTRRTFFL